MDYQNRYRDTLNRKAEFGSSEPSEDRKNDLGEVEKDLADFQSCVDSIGTPLNTDHNRAEVKRLRSLIKRRLGDAKSKVDKQRKGTQHEQIEAKQLTKQLNNYVQRFDRLLSQERDLTRQHQDLTDSVRMDSFNGSEAPMVHYQQDQVIVTEVEERERTAAELVELEKDIVDLHNIQKDLAGMVQEQGEVTDNIETNVGKSAVKVEQGKRKLDSAVEIKRKNRKLYLAICLLVGIPLVIILIVIVIVLAVVLPNNN